VRGKVVGHGCSGHFLACPVKAIIRRVLHLRSNNAPPTTPLAAVGSTFQPVSPAAVLSMLRRAGAAYEAHTGATLPHITLHALRATGASALLSQGASSDTIRLLGRWRSDASLRYLHLQNHVRISSFAKSMLHSTPLPAPTPT
jgi:integrase